MTNQTLTKGSDVLQKYDYGYGQIDVNGNLNTTKNNGQLGRIDSTIGAAQQWTQKFSYDSIGRLSQASEYRGDNINTLSYKQKFDYDRFGNLYRKNASNPAAGQANPLPYTPIEDADVSKSTNRFNSNTTYDNAGNVTQDLKFRNSNFWYDANGRMFKASKTDNSSQANSVYDASGKRVAEQIDGVWSFFIYDAMGKLVSEYGGLQAMDEGGVKYVLQDWQGSSRAILSNTGSVTTRMDYTAFGEEIQAGVGQRTTAQGFGATNNLTPKYGSTERDKATGLDHTWFRKNETRAGRWTSPDPYNGSMSLGNPQSFNKYAYVGNDPTNFIDPSGLEMYICRTYDEGSVNLSTGVVTIHERTECEVYFSGGGGGPTIFPTTIGDPGRGGGGGLGGGGGGSGNPTPETPPKKPHCKQGGNGEDKNEIDDGLAKAGLLDQLEERGQSPNSPEGFLYYTADRENFLATIEANSAFIYNTGLGGLHTKDVGKGNIDNRSQLWSGPGLGRDKNGVKRSLQVTVGKRDPITGLATVYADKDCVNPAEGALPFLVHGVSIGFGKIGNFFGF